MRIQAPRPDAADSGPPLKDAHKRNAFTLLAGAGRFLLQPHARLEVVLRGLWTETPGIGDTLLSENTTAARGPLPAGAEIAITR
ncbi:hypothetical protein IWW55_003849 [Coemansia sp. RSA 2706]|nr:hypothetical protein IWW55_003849 [Coemansia sp. RSA 2706]